MKTSVLFHWRLLRRTRMLDEVWHSAIVLSAFKLVSWVWHEQKPRSKYYVTNHIYSGGWLIYDCFSFIFIHWEFFSPKPRRLCSASLAEAQEARRCRSQHGSAADLGPMVPWAQDLPGAFCRGWNGKRVFGRKSRSGNPQPPNHPKPPTNQKPNNQWNDHPFAVRVFLIATYALYANAVTLWAYARRWRNRNGRLRIAGEAVGGVGGAV